MRQPYEVVRDRLAVYLGPHTARNALRTFSEKTLGVSPETISSAQAQKLLDALRPMLKTLVGAAQCDRILSQLHIELELHS
ncbi:MAG TPA: hypothetical protein VKE22_21340 [Haliangiales bacterium]|nr:hypothetical protein [Haliangiales bacterium]